MKQYEVDKRTTFFKQENGGSYKEFFSLPLFIPVTTEGHVITMRDQRFIIVRTETTFLDDETASLDVYVREEE